MQFLCKTDYRREATRLRSEAAEVRLHILLHDRMRPAARKIAEQAVAAKMRRAGELEAAAELLGAV